MQAPATDRLIAWGASLAAVAESAMNFVTSYQHNYTLGLRYGEYGTDARLNPICIDLALLAFGLLNLYLARKGRKSWFLRLALGAGVVGTIAANGAYGAFWGDTGALLAVWSPVLLFATVEGGMVALKVAAEVAEEEAKKAKLSERATKAANTRKGGTPDMFVPQIFNQEPQPGGPDAAEAARQRLADIRAGKEQTPAPELALSGIGLSQNRSY
jgi:hypothetical protein